MTEIIANNNIEELNQKAAQIISDSILKLSNEKNRIIIGIVGGRSVSGIFNELKNLEIPWEKVHIFMVDEKLVPIDDEQNNFLLAKKAFIDTLVRLGNLPSGNVHPFIINEEKDDLGIMDYSEELKFHGSRFDIILLSSGEDGHIGALYPNHSSIEDESDYFIKMNDSPKPPKNRMSASKKLLKKSQVSVIMFLGEEKRDALELFKDKKIKEKSCPAKIVNDIEKSYLLTNIL